MINNFNKKKYEKTKKNENKKNKKKYKKNERTKKKNEKKIWDKFHEEVNKNKNVECLYTKSNNEKRTKCDICSFDVALNNDNFLVCTNNKCGLIYKDILILTPEWG